MAYCSDFKPPHENASFAWRTGYSRSSLHFLRHFSSIAQFFKSWCHHSSSFTRMLRHYISNQWLIIAQTARKKYTISFEYVFVIIMCMATSEIEAIAATRFPSFFPFHCLPATTIPRHTIIIVYSSSSDRLRTSWHLSWNSRILHLPFVPRVYRTPTPRLTPSLLAHQELMSKV